MQVRYLNNVTVIINPLLQDLINDIEGHRGKALYVLDKHAELHAVVGEESRLHNTNLASEINTLLEQAHTDRDELRESVAQQELYETEMRSLTSSISEAQERLIGSPIQASSVNDLRTQITERNVSFCRLGRQYCSKDIVFVFTEICFNCFVLKMFLYIS